MTSIACFRHVRHIGFVALQVLAAVSASATTAHAQTQTQTKPPVESQAKPQTPAPASPAPAAAVAPAAQSVFVPLALERCKRVSSDKDGGRWACGGPKGYEVLFAEGDLRQFMAYGAKAREQRAAGQTLGPFNSIFKEASSKAGRDQATIQWRGTMQGGKFVPFATVVRYHTDTGDDGSGKRRRGQVLVVTKLGPPDGNEACHAAYIDAAANKDANALATRTADEMARTFDCRKDPIIAGEKGPLPPILPTRT